MTSVRCIQPLTAGVSSYATPAGLLNLAQAPVAARADVMKQGAGAALIMAVADYSSFSTQGGTFYFDSVIPSDSTTYYLLMEFFLP